MASQADAPTVYGLMAEFETPDALVSATEKARLAGYRRMDAYSPIPIEELNEALGLNRTRLPKLVFLFIRVLPMISIFEMRTLVPEAKVDEDLRVM